MLKSIDIFVGGSTDPNISESYYNTAIELGQKINERGDYTITFDGCLGLPFLVFNELDCTSRATIYKTCYYSNEYIFKSSAIIHEFRHQSDFIQNIPENSDAMIFMKGGISTITEVMYAIETKKNNEHDKPIVILNINDEWNELVSLLDGLKMDNIYYITDNVTDALNYIESKLFDSKNSFKHFLQFMERKEPIIEKKYVCLK